MNRTPDLPPFLCNWSHPEPRHKPQPLWVWNGEVTRARITEMLEQFAARGIGGVFIHPRPGLVTEYLSEEWFDLWEFSVHECQRLGLECHIYDENSFPAGFAGGHVIANNPLATSSMLFGRPGPLPDTAIRGSRQRARRLMTVRRDSATGAVRILGPGEPVSANNDNPVLHLELQTAASSLWQGGYTYVDLCRPEVTDLFLELTHGAYARRLGAHFGTTVRYAFADEPEVGYGGDGLNFSHYLLHEFRQDHGYDLMDRLIPLCFPQADSAAVRHDYFSTLNRLFVQNYARRCHDWCARHNLQFTGHFMEHQWPYPKGSPSTMAVQRWMHAPGIDLLGFQFKPTSLVENAAWLLNVKEASSAAAQAGRDTVLCESCGGGGYDFSPADMRPLEDFLLASGINLINPHLSHETLSGARKYDWPHTLSDHSPWWDAYGVQARHVARTNHLLCQGRETHRILVLLPTTTGWLHYRPKSLRWPDEEGTEQPMEQLRLSVESFLTGAYASQLDFELGDEFILAELGEPADGRLRAGARTYDWVVLPPGTDNLVPSTLDLLARHVEAGGRVASLDTLPRHINGRVSDAATRLAAAHPGAWHQFPTADALLAHLRRVCPPHWHAADGGPVPGAPVWRRSVLPDDSVLWFICNPWSAPVDTEVELPGAFLQAFDTATGQVDAVPSVHEAGRLRVRLNLAPRGHVLWRACPQRPPSAVEASPPAPIAVELTLGATRALQPNLLMLDYCDWEGAGLQAADLNTLHADTRNWHAQGFDQNLWRVSIQFRRCFLEAGIPPRSGFTVRHHFVADAAFDPVQSGLELAVERAALYEIRVNGIPIDSTGGRRWFDEAMRLLPIAHAVRAGCNTIELTRRPFHVLAEIMPVYLRGAFTLRAAERGFVLLPEAPLEAGDWTAQGRPFDAGFAATTARFTLPEAAGALRLEVPEWLGSAGTVLLDGKTAGHFLFHPGRLDIAGPVAAGAHELEIRIAGNLKNMMGPHFCDGLPGGWSWEHCPDHQPPGSRYRFYPTGLTSTPRLSVLHPA